MNFLTKVGRSVASTGCCRRWDTTVAVGRRPGSGSRRSALPALMKTLKSLTTFYRVKRASIGATERTVRGISCETSIRRMSGSRVIHEVLQETLPCRMDLADTDRKAWLQRSCPLLKKFFRLWCWFHVIFFTVENIFSVVWPCTIDSTRRVMQRTVKSLLNAFCAVGRRSPNWFTGRFCSCFKARLHWIIMFRRAKSESWRQLLPWRSADEADAASHASHCWHHARVAARWRTSLVRQYTVSSFNRKHRILSLQICGRSTERT